MKITVQEAIQRLKAGEVVALPTETVYGLAASISSQQGIEAIFRYKNRPQDNPLIIHLASVEALHAFVEEFPPFLTFFWPGPLTIVLPVKKEVLSPIILANLPTGAFRVPNHPLTLEVLKEVGPLVMPSANLSGRPSATSPEHVEADFGQDFPVLDGGTCQSGVESTIICYEDGWKILRLGAISRKDIEEVLKTTLLQGKTVSPGQKYRHYAPKAHLILTKKIPEEADVILGFNDRQYPTHARLFSLGSSQDPKECTHHLYRQLRALDHHGIKEVWVDIDFPKTDLFETLLERLQKAAL